MPETLELPLLVWQALLCLYDGSANKVTISTNGEGKWSVESYFYQNTKTQTPIPCEQALAILGTSCVIVDQAV